MREVCGGGDKPAQKIVGGAGVGVREGGGGSFETPCRLICPNVLVALMDEPILVKLHTVTVYNLRMCMKEDNPGPNYFK